MRLSHLLEDVPVVRLTGDPSVDIADVTHDSRQVHPGALFCCIPGRLVDGHDLAPEAVERGAVALLCERELAVDATQVVVERTRVAMAPVAAAAHGQPSRHLTVVGVTGTNGKSTTAALVRSIFDAAGRPAGLIGTMTGARTTPEAPDLQRQLAAYVAEGKRAAAIEVSSVGLTQHRVDAVWFAAAVFTNLSPDELGYHGSVDAYFAAKATLFTADRCAVAVVNADDHYGQRLLRDATVPCVTFSMDDAVDLHMHPGGSTFTWRGHAIDLRLGGRFNVLNALAAATVTAAVGIDEGEIAAALSNVPGVPGHAEAIEAGQPFAVLVDYAHTGGAITAVLASARELVGEGGRVIVVFGAGGDRDPTRRALMGRAASRAADLMIVTSDNPRSEDPQRIIDMIVEGADGAAELVVEVDRRRAISRAFELARTGDAVVIAGKGAEQGQEVNGEVVPFDDRVVARELLAP